VKSFLFSRLFIFQTSLGFSLNQVSQLEWMMIDNNKWLTTKLIVNLKILYYVGLIESALC